jgi:hypothetical protein
MLDVKIREFYKMDPSYNCTSIKALVVIIAYGQHMLQDTNSYNDRCKKKTRMIPSPLYLLQVWRSLMENSNTIKMEGWNCEAWHNDM